MRVAISLSKFYNWDPVPKGVVVTEEDIAAGKVMPGRDGAYRMKVVKAPPGGTEHLVTVSESTLIEKIIEEKSDVRKAGRTLSRRQALAHLLQDNIIPGQFEWDWIKGFAVHDDGPNEELMRSKLELHTKAEHGRRPGRMNVPVEHVEDHVKAYMESTTAADHVDHLHLHFGIKKVSS